MRTGKGIGKRDEKRDGASIPGGRYEKEEQGRRRELEVSSPEKRRIRGAHGAGKNTLSVRRKPTK